METQKWIDVKKELPPVEQHVVIWYNVGTKQAPFYRTAVGQLFSNKKKFLYLDGMIDVANVIGWLPIPEFKLN